LRPRDVMDQLANIIFASIVCDALWGLDGGYRPFSAPLEVRWKGLIGSKSFCWLPNCLSLLHPNFVD
jgi:hypothetical protein